MNDSLFEICKSVFAAADIEKVLPFVLDYVIQKTGAQRCRIVLFDHDGEELFNRGRKKGSEEDDQEDTKVSSKIMALVKSTNRIFVSANAMTDARLRDEAQALHTVIAQGVQSVACAPIRDREHVFGVVYIDTRAQSAIFNENTGELLKDLAGLMSEALRKSLENTLKLREETGLLQRHISHLSEEVDKLLGYGEMVGTSAAMKEIYRLIDRVKHYDENVLLTGESGTGKGLLARTLHQKSDRAAKNFIQVDCAAIPENMLASELFGHEKGAFTGALNRKLGLFEIANGGTIFLDEIGNMNLSVQASLLDFIDTKRFRRLGATQWLTADVRLVFATNRNLEEMMSTGQFKEDLYFRIARGIKIELPPLRERGNDVLLIAEKLLAFFCKKYKLPVMRFSEEANACLLRHPYAGNVRELESFVAHAVRFAEGPVIAPEDLPEKLRLQASAKGARGEAVSFKIPKPGEEDFYAQYLPEEFQGRNFIWGMDAEAKKFAINDSARPQPAFHDLIIASVKRSFGLPLPTAVKAAGLAFERNFIIAKLREAKGKIQEAAMRCNIDRGTLNDKLKVHGLKSEWFVD